MYSNISLLACHICLFVSYNKHVEKMNEDDVYKMCKIKKSIVSTISFIWFTISWWRHRMEKFFALLALCVRNSSALVNSPHKDQWRRALVFSLICVWINGWVNNREASDLRCYRAHYDVTLMCSVWSIFRWIHCGFSKTICHVCYQNIT